MSIMRKSVFCKKDFMSTLDIGDTIIRTGLNNNDYNNNDFRGRQGNPKKGPIIERRCIRYIESLPIVKSHY